MEYEPVLKGAEPNSPWRAMIGDDGGVYFKDTVMHPEKAPVSFSYDGQKHVGFAGCEVL